MIPMIMVGSERVMMTMCSRWTSSLGWKSGGIAGCTWGFNEMEVFEGFGTTNEMSLLYCDIRPLVLDYLEHMLPSRIQTNEKSFSTQVKEY